MSGPCELGDFLARAAAVVPVRPRSAPGAAGTPPYRVLIVDDEPAQRQLEREILQPPKFQVTEVADGAAALALLATEEFDAVLLDKRMPGLDGDEVCRRIRGELDASMLPVIMVTGSAATSDLSSSLRAGATDFVRKPYETVELLARVDAAVQRKRLTDRLENAEALLFALARMVEAKDENTGDHCTRLSRQAVQFGRWLGLGGEELLALRRGGVLHDIGKLGIPDSILLKAGPLDAAEWAVMRTHPVIGERLCQGLKSFRLTNLIIRSHHERWDGSGYPDALRGEEIPLLARVFQLCDIYDGLCHARPYKAAWPSSEALRILAEETDRGWRDPALAESFRAFVAVRQPAPEELDDDLGLTLYEAVARGRADCLPAGS